MQRNDTRDSKHLMEKKMILHEKRKIEEISEPPIKKRRLSKSNECCVMLKKKATSSFQRRLVFIMFDLQNVQFYIYHEEKFAFKLYTLSVYTVLMTIYDSYIFFLEYFC